ncbi:hypothetical protein [Bordetella bronchiseptica]|uniref:hypothetical protein n=1 Tax=Bordetella bronchiseptica TaxID=518 RepID=UPI000460ABD3|nr:hypothetical protein [Bordetella bronchiseptica]KDD19309.1 hypothetical protein L522_2984 [Bordetella bronchiseptica MBORD707]
MTMPPKLFVLGSCRVHRPARLLHDGGLAQPLTAGISGYIHSTREAVQRVQWLADRTRLDSQLLPFMFPAGRTPVVTPARADELAQADAVLVEAASERSVSVNGVFLQKNLVIKHLVRELGDEGRNWWRSLVRAGEVAPEAYEAVAGLYRDQAEETVLAGGLRVLREARCAEDSEAVVRADLMYLALRLGKPVLVVTHVDAERADGRRIAARVRHVARIKAAARGLHQVHVIDPLDAAPDWPPARLLASDGADMNHYSPEFEPVLAGYMHTRIRAALAASSGALAPSQFLPEYQDGP